MVLHQNFDEPLAFHRMVSALRSTRLHTPAELRRFAETAGFEIHTPNTVDDCWQLYHDCDIHIGSRLHAHLYFLSQAKQSYLVRVDERANGFAEALGFELFDPRDGVLPVQDFEGYRTAALRVFENMKTFVFATKRLLEAA
jgi:hypothetical protein